MTLEAVLISTLLFTVFSKNFFSAKFKETLKYELTTFDSTNVAFVTLEKTEGNIFFKRLS